MFTRTIAVAACMLLALKVSSAAPPAKRASKEAADSAKPVVQEVLRREITSSVDRRAELKSALERHPESSLAFWQAGFVREFDQWRSFDAPPSSTTVDRLQSYQRQRDAASPTAEGQLRLADWCLRNRLPDQERVHLTVALNQGLSPKQAEEVAQRLGLRRVAGQWLSREQLLDWKERNQRTSESLEIWQKKFEQIARQLDGSLREADAGRAALREIRDPRAIPAVEFVLAGRSEAAALAGVNWMRERNDFESSQALARQAAFSKWEKVRQGSIEVLKDREFRDFVPQLIDLLATAAESGVAISIVPAWNSLVYSFIAARETDDQFQMAAFHRINQFVVTEVRATGIPNDALPTVNTRVNERATNDLTRQTAAAAKAFHVATTERWNRQSEAMNKRIARVLAAISGREESSDPRKWWNWWTEQSEQSKAPGKAVVRVDEFETTYTPVTIIRAHSCFAAGTPVMTEIGPTPIEKIRVGDRVLSKDIETGELSYKPVMQTTIGPRQELFAVQFQNESLTATGGHRFWVSGEGWVKARDLKPQSLIHTATGNTPVWSVKKGPATETYNLVVDGFHTYFVGKGAMLVQDLPLPQPTNCVVPGLPRSEVAAKK